MKEVAKIVLITIKNKKNLLIILVVINILLLITYAAIWPSLATQMKALNDLMVSLPPAFLKAFNIEGQLNGGFESMLITKQFGATLPILLVILTTILSAEAISDEIDKGSILIYLTQPITRAKYYISRYLSGSIFILIFSILSVLIAVPISWIFNLEVTPSHYITYTLSTFLLGMTLFSIGYLVSSFSSDSKKVVLISIVVFIFSYVLNVISGLTTDLSGLKYFSLIYYFGPSENIVEYSIPIFILTSVICFLLGLQIFKKRDISIR